MTVPEIPDAQRPTIIIGTARSGTSIVAGIIQACGAWGGNVGGAHPNNIKGCFENLALRQMEKRYLQEIGCDPLAQNPLPKPGSIKPVDYGAKVWAVLQSEGYSGGPWYYKSPKACHTWPNWHMTFPRARWIVCLRDHNDIINSCLKARMMRAYKDRDGWRVWIKHHEDRFAEMRDAGLDIREVWTKKIVGGDYSEIKDAVEHCGLTWNERAVNEFVSPELYHLNGVLAHGKG